MNLQLYLKDKYNIKSIYGALRSYPHSEDRPYISLSNKGISSGISPIPKEKYVEMAPNSRGEKTYSVVLIKTLSMFLFNLELIIKGILSTGAEINQIIIRTSPSFSTYGDTVSCRLFIELKENPFNPNRNEYEDKSEYEGQTLNSDKFMSISENLIGIKFLQEFEDKIRDIAHKDRHDQSIKNKRV